MLEVHHGEEDNVFFPFLKTHIGQYIDENKFKVFAEEHGELIPAIATAHKVCR
jgi:hemerythrin-like domain-containing protein